MTHALKIIDIRLKEPMPCMNDILKSWDTILTFHNTLDVRFVVIFKLRTTNQATQTFETMIKNLSFVESYSYPNPPNDSASTLYGVAMSAIQGQLMPHLNMAFTNYLNETFPVKATLDDKIQIPDVINIYRHAFMKDFVDIVVRERFRKVLQEVNADDMGNSVCKY